MIFLVHHEKEKVMFDKIEESARRKIGELAAAEAELRAKLAEITKEARSNKTRPP